jgi:hypothetical protein
MTEHFVFGVSRAIDLCVIIRLLIITRQRHLTRSGPNYSAIEGGKIRPNPLASILKAGKNGAHERDSIASADGRQTETARSSA